MNPRLLVPVAVVAVLLLGVVWFLQNYERVPDKQHVGASGEARLRPFLAAERFAERMGLPARELRSPPQIAQLTPGAALLLPARRQALGDAQIAQLLSWVAAGGHAIVEAERQPLSDPLLDRLKVGRKADRKPPKPGVPFLPDELFNSVQVEAQLPTTTRPLSVLFNLDSKLDPGARPTLARVTAGDSIKLVSFRHGKGVFTVCTSLDFARNARIGLGDDAEFLWSLLQLSSATEFQVFFHPERLSLWGFLAEHAAPVLLAGFLLLALWLWRIAPRFGPVPADAPPARRRLLDHLRASGRYLWAEGERLPLALAARDAALRRLSRVQPDFAPAPAAEKAARVAALAAIPIDDAQRFMAAAGALRGAEFMRLAAIAQRVHFALERGSR